MTRYATRDCDCPDVVTGHGGKRPDECPCGNRFLTEAQLRPPRPHTPLRSISKKRQEEIDAGERPHTGSTLKQKEPKRDWTDARAKVDHEGCCRICKRTDLPLEAAHALGREHDEPKLGKDGWPTKELYVHPDRIIPACGPFPAGCHGDVDHNRVNYLQYLSLAEQIKAVEDAGGIEAARIRLEPVEHNAEVDRDRARRVELEAAGVGA